LVQVQVQVQEVKFKFKNFLELELFLDIYQSLICTCNQINDGGKVLHVESGRKQKMNKKFKKQQNVKEKKREDKKLQYFIYKL
jgi:hypothetical protein